MKDSKTILEHVAQEKYLSKKGLPIQAGQTKQHFPSAELANTINQIFGLFSINFHNQFHTAYKNAQTESQAKNLWLDNLKDFPSEILLMATKRAIAELSYLPTIHQMRVFCQEAEGNRFPNVHAAYVEACNATVPRQNYRWSHPVVYYAGKRCQWQFLLGNDQSVAFPVFKAHYQALCDQILSGQALPPIDQLALPESIEAPLSKDENAKRMESLRKALDI
ncbi:MAG: hypothetical protein AAFZ92_01735 [Pseudomonadota bacterium]